MATFIADRFNAETDEDRPITGSEHSIKGSPHIVKKVEHILLADVIAGKKEPEKGKYDLVLCKPHKDRPAVIWVTWFDKKA